MTRQSTVDKPKTRCISHQSSPVCARRKLAGFADKSTSVAPTQTQTRDTPLVPFNEKGTGSLVVGSGSSSSETGASSTSASTTAQTRSRPSNEYVLYSYGEPVAMTADGNASYFGTDILGSVRNVTDKYGAVQSEYNYDVFGSPYLSNLDNDMSFGYCGKIYDNGTGLYDYGFRDYSPNQARFTTVDPIRDGSNWFAYVVNDPVNYVDPFGLTATAGQNIKETLSDVKSAITNFLFPGEITNNTEHNLFPRADSNKIHEDLLKNGFIIRPGQTLSSALANNPNISHKQLVLDGLVLPDGSIYKGWAGSNITVIEKKDANGKISYQIIESLGTKIIHKIVNAGRDFLNKHFRSEGKQKDLYKHYSAEEIKDLATKPHDNVFKWYNDIPLNYFNQNEGCSK
ncbi:MAG: RHS repeat-associated core domain-containing protein [Candidatus Gastranaerophilales bacterium]|nr:RHS repeat-associated core domain-containing protein [Candidatus Gastranaerophilales bacterium]